MKLNWTIGVSWSLINYKLSITRAHSYILLDFPSEDVLEGQAFTLYGQFNQVKKKEKRMVG